MAAAVVHNISVVVVGDQRCGKSTLIDRFIWNDVSPEYKPTSFDKFSVKKLVGQDEISFTIWDTSGSPAYDSIRPLSYNEADIFMLCFSVPEPNTLLRIQEHWIPEVRKHRPDAPILLCGCMAKLRNDIRVIDGLRSSGQGPVSPEQAMQICSQVGIGIYIDTSAGEGLKEVVEAFDMAAVLTLEHRELSMGQDDRIIVRPGSSASDRLPLGTGRIHRPSGSRPGSTTGRPGSAASCGAASSASHGSRVLIPGNSREFHGSFSNLPVSSLTLDPLPPLDLIHKPGPMHKQSRSLDSPAGETIHEEEMMDSPGTHSPRSVHKRATSPLHSPLGHAQFRSLSPSSLPSSPLKAPLRPSLTNQSSNLSDKVPQSLGSLEKSSLGSRAPCVPLRSTQSQQFSTIQEPLHSRSFSQPVSSLQQAINFTNRLEQLAMEEDNPGRTPPAITAKSAELGFWRENTNCKNQISRQISNVSQQFGELAQTNSPDLDLRNKPPERNSQKMTFRASLPVGRPPLPVPPLPKSPSDLNQGRTTSTSSPITQEPLPRRLAHLGLAEGKNYESLKSHTSTISHGSTGSKLSTASSLSGHATQFYTGPRDFDIPDTEDPELLKNLDFVSPKAGVYRPVNPGKSVGKKDKCSVM